MATRKPQTEIVPVDPLLFSDKTTEVWMNQNPKIIPGVFQSAEYAAERLAMWGITERYGRSIDADDLYAERQRRYDRIAGGLVKAEVFFDEEAFYLHALSKAALLGTITTVRSAVVESPDSLTIGILPSVSNKSQADWALWTGNYVVIHQGEERTYLTGSFGHVDSNPDAIKLIDISHDSYRQHTIQGPDILPLLERAEEVISQR